MPRVDPSSKAAVLAASAPAERLMGREIYSAVRDAKRAIREAAENPDIVSSAAERQKVYAAILRRLAAAAGKLTPALEEAIDKRSADVAAGVVKTFPASKRTMAVPRPLTRDQKITAMDGKTVRDLVATQTQAMSANAIKKLRTAFVEVNRRAATENWTANDLHKELQKAWDDAAGDDSTFRFVDKSGRAWENARYIQMNVRTTMATITRNTQIETLTSNGMDLARISSDGGGDGECEACARWEGRLISLTGANKAIPTLAAAKADGLFHPNCVHRIEYVDEDELTDAERALLSAPKLSKAEREAQAGDGPAPSSPSPSAPSKKPGAESEADRKAEEERKAEEARKAEEERRRSRSEALASSISDAVSALASARQSVAQKVRQLVADAKFDDARAALDAVKSAAQKVADAIASATKEVESWT